MGAQNEGIAASLLRAYMPFRIADADLRNSKKQPAAEVGHRWHITRNFMISRAGPSAFMIRNHKSSPLSRLSASKNF